MFWKETGNCLHPQRYVMWCIILPDGALAHSCGITNIIRTQWMLCVRTKSPWLHFVTFEKPKAREGGNYSELLAELSNRDLDILRVTSWDYVNLICFKGLSAFWDSSTSAECCRDLSVQAWPLSSPQKLKEATTTWLCVIPIWKA